MAKKVPKPKTTIPEVPFYKKVWVQVLVIGTFVIGFLGKISDVTSGLDAIKQGASYFFSETQPKKDSVLVCSFPKKFQKDTLYILVTRFEDDILAVESDCYGESLKSSINKIAYQKNIPIRVCYRTCLVEYCS